MATGYEVPASTAPQAAGGEMVVELGGVGWSGFESIAALKADRRQPRLIYANGDLTFVSPSYAHESWADRLDVVVKAVTSELDIPRLASAATMFRRRDLDRAIEGDKTYYLAHEAAIRGKMEIDLDVDPPPDLAIEVEVTHSARQAVEIWRRLGVSEVWVFSAPRVRLRILILQEDGSYVESPLSRVLPVLRAAEIEEWLPPQDDEPQSRWETRLRGWVRDELARRVAGS